MALATGDRVTYAAEEAAQQGEALQGQADDYIVRLSEQLRALEARIATAEADRARVHSSARASPPLSTHSHSTHSPPTHTQVSL